MKRIAWLSVLALCSAALVCAQSASKAKQMTGTICDSGCVVQQADTATCNPACKHMRGEAVFIDDQGGVREIMNQDVCKTHMGKHVKMTAVPENPKIIPIHAGEEWLQIEDLQDTNQPTQ